MLICKLINKEKRTIFNSVVDSKAIFYSVDPHVYGECDLICSQCRLINEQNHICQSDLFYDAYISPQKSFPQCPPFIPRTGVDLR